MRLTEEEVEFLRKYRKLSDYDRGRIDATIDIMRRPPDWGIVREEEENDDAGTVQKTD